MLLMPSLPGGRYRRRALRTVALLLLAPLAVGCVRVQAAITVSTDDKVSGNIIAAVKPRDSGDTGPQFDAASSVGFSQKIAVSPYEADGYVGSQANFADLSFAELPQLANLSNEAAGVDISLRRAGDLVILEGRVDLTSVTDPEAEVSFSATFPGEVTSTNGDRAGAGSVEWKLKPGVVTNLNAQARYTDPSARSFTAAGISLVIAAFLVAGLIAALAWRDRDQTSPRFAGAGEESDRTL